MHSMSGIGAPRHPDSPYRSPTIPRSVRSLLWVGVTRRMTSCIVLGCNEKCTSVGGSSSKFHKLCVESALLPKRVFLAEKLTHQVASYDLECHAVCCQKCYLKARNATSGDGAGSWIHGEEGLLPEAATRLARAEYILSECIVRFPPAVQHDTKSKQRWSDARHARIAPTAFESPAGTFLHRNSSTSTGRGFQAHTLPCSYSTAMRSLTN